MAAIVIAAAAVVRTLRIAVSIAIRFAADGAILAPVNAAFVPTSLTIGVTLTVIGAIAFSSVIALPVVTLCALLSDISTAFRALLGNTALLRLTDITIAETLGALIVGAVLCAFGAAIPAVFYATILLAFCPPFLAVFTAIAASFLPVATLTVSALFGGGGGGLSRSGQHSCHHRRSKGTKRCAFHQPVQSHGAFPF